MLQIRYVSHECRVSVGLEWLPVVTIYLFARLSSIPSCDGIVSGSSGIVESVNCLNQAYYIII